MNIDIKELKDSNEFLNILLQNMDSAVFIADEYFKIHQFNDSFLTLFNRSDSNLVDITFGPASGCINAVKENKPCGETSACKNCIINQTLRNTVLTQEPDEKKFLERIFYIGGVPVKKYLEFTSRSITFRNQRMILVFIYDITKSELSKIELQQKQKQIDIDLEKAGEIQKSLLPKNLPIIPSIKACWFFEPCLMVGGDIFHLYKEDETHISTYILDVCGHGVSAALIAVTVKQFLDQLHTQGLSKGILFQPEEILNALENEFPFERFDCFFTIVYVLLNVKTGEVTYGCAGHVPPLVIGRSGKFEVLNQHGTIIGLGQDPPLSQYKIQLNPGDKIILYTDGLIDYFGEKGAYPNKENFYTTLRRLSDKPANQIVKQVITEQKKLWDNSEVDDDISLLVIEYNGFNS
ncbi:MAG: serine/threonine-protein phosphatase [Desulfobacula sp.]|uniref:PP2C family protein-serine/threonine phosphatase n=1 Tax=Desulfobacula sp. TaxID=2593537 RepID=UPI0025B8066C|nr:PP2C family protein-serine/threonine phosphatase [Desulfobacula sp.]MCD4719780.1 serine/threonine-protein phosphatase [Desulfobacula sp.]